MKPFFEITLSEFNLWIFTGIFLALNVGFVLLFPKYNIKKFISVPKVRGYNGLNKISWYALLLMSIFIPIKTERICFYFGLVFFLAGMLFYSVSMFYFAISEYHLPVTSGIYRFSRHPVYVSFFIIVLGMFLLTLSGFLFIIAILHFYSLYFIIKKEEKMCENRYGSDYLNYKQKTKRLL